MLVDILDWLVINADYLFGIGSLFFVVALIPSIISKNKPHPGTSLITAAILYMFATIYVGMYLEFAAIVTYVTAICWSILFIQGFNND
jgi:hypothetical protein